MLKSGSCDTMTDPAQAGLPNPKKSSGISELTRVHRAHYRVEGERSRNVREGKKISLSSINHVRIDAVPVRKWSRLTTTNNDMDATDSEIRRLRCD